MKEAVSALIALPLGAAWMLAGPVTYIINVVDTWTGSTPVLLKLLINLTLDAFLAAIWPVTWAIWLLTEVLGGESALSRVFG